MRAGTILSALTLGMAAYAAALSWSYDTGGHASDQMIKRGVLTCTLFGLIPLALVSLLCVAADRRARRQERSLGVVLLTVDALVGLAAILTLVTR